jgi:hypothetical protein
LSRESIWYLVYLHRADRGQQRTHHPRILWLILRLAADLGLRTPWRLYGGAWRACCGLGALDNGASDHGARRALTDFARLVARRDARRARWYGGLQDVFGHVWRSRALCFQHIPRHVGLRRARRNTGLEYILGPVNRGTLVVAMVGFVIGVFIVAAARFLATHITVALRDRYESLRYLR